MSGDLRTPHKLGRLVLAPSARDGDFDRHGVDCAFPFRLGTGWLMTYIGWDGLGYRTGVASSPDLLHWRKEGLLLDRGPAGSTTEYNVALTMILRENDLFSPGELRPVGGRYIGTWHAYPRPGYETGPAVIGLAHSEDLRHWQLGLPALRPSDGAPWEAGGLYKSWLLEHDGTYYLFYNAKTCGEPWVEQIGVATSPDLATWRRHPDNPILRVSARPAFDDIFVSDPCVFRVGDRWVMFHYTLSSDGHARDSVAYSDDLLHWEKSGEILVDVGRAGECDSRYAHKPALIAHDGRLYHFYTAVAPPRDKRGHDLPGEVRGISLACSQTLSPRERGG